MSILSGNGASVTALTTATAIGPTDIVAVNQAGVDVKASAQQIVTVELPTVQLAANTTLSTAAHNGRKLVCTAVLTLSLPATPSTLGDGFGCLVLNLSGGTVTLGAGIASSTGISTIGATQRVPLDGTLIGATYTLLATLPSAGVAATPPGQVTGLAVGTLTGSSAVLSWTAPASGGTPSAYTVEYSSNGGTSYTTASGSASGSPYTVTGLIGSTAYTFRVTATNSVGAGTPSTTATGTTLAPAPGQVTALTVGAVTSSSVALSWTAPITGGTVASYKVQDSLDAGATWTTVATPTGTSATVSGLTASTTYNFRVIASNASGDGTPSTAASAATVAITSTATNYAAIIPAGGSVMFAYDGSNPTGFLFKDAACTIQAAANDTVAGIKSADGGTMKFTLGGGQIAPTLIASAMNSRTALVTAGASVMIANTAAIRTAIKAGQFVTLLMVTKLTSIGNNQQYFASGQLSNPDPSVEYHTTGQYGMRLQVGNGSGDVYPSPGDVTSYQACTIAALQYGVGSNISSRVAGAANNPVSVAIGANATDALTWDTDAIFGGWYNNNLGQRAIGGGTVAEYVYFLSPSAPSAAEINAMRAYTNTKWAA